MKTCKACGKVLPVKQGPGRKFTYCPGGACRQRSFRLRTIYNLPHEQYQLLQQVQNNKCAICGCSEPLVIDHDHTTGRVRGLLCHACNNGIGRFKDNIEYLLNAVAYLQKEDYGRQVY